ncbi:MAG TPA: hypothetical protein VF868_13320 [Bacteroidia bacterium]|jgi:hypothetical protein
MKKLALFLTFYLSILTIAPAFVQLFPCLKQTAESTCASTYTGKEDCGKEAGSKCPFGICCCNCLFFNLEKKEIVFIAPAITQEGFKITDEHHSSSYIPDCWHPPETA